MDYTSQFIMITGFLLAAYSVVGNDVIQTLGTFLTSNADRPWWVLWLFAASILTATLVTGWVINDGDVAWGRLSEIPYPEPTKWWFLLPPLVLLIITYNGIPVSTTFMILSVFSGKQVIEKMVLKSVYGYGLAFLVAFLVYLVIAKKFEDKEKLKETKINKPFWVAAQWLSTGFLWVQWLIQDFANIFVYLPRQLSLEMLLLSMAFLLLLLAVIFRQKGGRIQKIVTQKHNAAHIRSATLIDLTYGVVLFFFTSINPVPMSTTWTFVGILAGREYAISYLLHKHEITKTGRMVFRDLAKVNLGLAISVVLALIIRSLG